MYIHILAQTRFSLQYKVLTLSCYFFPLMRHSYLAAIPEALTYYFQIVKNKNKNFTLHC